MKFDSPLFEPPQIRKIGELLGLERLEDADKAADGIEGLVLCFRMMQHSKRRIPDSDKAKERLKRISEASAHLLNLLNDRDLVAPINDVPVNPVGEFPGLEKLHRSPLWDYDELSCDSLFDLLSRISRNSSVLSKNDALFRSRYMLPPERHKSKNPEVYALWPGLFDFWLQANKPVNYTPDGKLHCFVAFIHECLGLSRPSASTFRDAVKRWQAEGASRPKHPAPWLFDPEF